MAATPILLIAAGLLIIRFRKLDWGEDVGFQRPSLKLAILWLLAFLMLAAAQQLFAEGDSAAGSWRGKYDAAGIAVRILAVGLIYPVAEEFFFRGVFFGVLSRRLGAAVAILVPAIVFGLIHVQYDGPVWVVADGILFGLARFHTGSVYIPMLLHVLGNGYAVWERLA